MRRDQGGDTVSEGQGYALLLAYAADEQHTFDRVWAWTTAHLLRGKLGGGFASRWDHGRVTDANSATDADVQIAWALVLGAHRFHQPGLRKQGLAVAGGVIRRELSYDDRGAPALAAGRWAIGTRRPFLVEPGYWTPAAEYDFAELTNDNRWWDLPHADLQHLKQLTDDGASLPPDWASLGSGQAIAAVPAPGTSQPIQSGANGLRAVVWTACTTAGRSLAARWWHLLAPTASAAPLSRHLDGTPADSDQTPLDAVAAAAAAKAAGDGPATRTLLDRASEIAAKFPTYYGSAWTALGRILLDTTELGAC